LTGICNQRAKVRSLENRQSGRCRHGEPAFDQQL